MSQVDWSQKFPRLKPAKAPPLARINGCGLGLYGHRDYDAETGTCVATLCFSLLFIPVLCLRAYRVAVARGGWYFLGREPLSAAAKGWNGLLVAGILLAVGVGKYEAYTSTPGYQAQRRMAAAHKLADGGRLAEAAKIYQELSLAGAEQAGPATDALKALLDGPCQQAPLAESAGVFACAAQAARRGHAIAPAGVADKGLKLAADRGDADPRDGVALLDAVRPLVTDTRPIDARRLALLRKWAAADPDNYNDVIYPLASLLEQQGQVADAKKLLLPVKDRLGSGEGARVLGAILGREGDYDGAYALLWPYVKGRLDKLHAAEKEANDTVERIERHELQALEDDKGPAGFKERFDSAGSDERKTMVREYVNGKVRNDPEFVRTQEALERAAEVVPVALELGIVMLQRAQGQTSPDARKSQLESAEKVFLAIGGVAGETDAYRVSLGRVYYWLGRQSEGRKLFDDYLLSKGRAFADLLAIAKALRELGATPEARALAEEAYNKTSKTDEQHAAASFRAVCNTDADDRIAWLRKGDAADPSVKADLAQALGDKALEQGDPAEAARQYRADLDALGTMPRTSTTLNDGALAWYGVFRATGDHEALGRCQDYLQQAVNLEPGDPILLFNAGITLLDGALADLIGGDIDLHALRETGDLALLGYLYRDRATRDAVVRRVKDHPGVARALSFLEKVTVLSPKDAKAFRAVFSVRQFTHDEAAMVALEQRVRAADLDTSDQVTRRKESLSGPKDQQAATALKAALARDEDRDGRLRAGGGRTAAVALQRQAAEMMSLDVYTGDADADKVVALSEEAERLAPSAATSGGVTAALLFRAAKDLRHSDPAFDSFFRQYDRSVGVSYLMAWAASEPGPFREKVARHPDVRKVIERLLEEGRRFPGSRSGYEWALLKSADPAAADEAAAAIRANPRKPVEQAIEAMVNPTDAGEALEAYWLAQVRGKPDEGREALRRVAALGVPVPGAE